MDKTIWQVAAGDGSRDYPEEKCAYEQRSKPNKGELIPSGTRSLARKKSDLAKRELELIYVLKNEQVRVLIGNFEDSLNELFSKIIKSKYDSMIRLSFSGEEILELAENGVIDIFILIINNIQFSIADSAGDFLGKSLQLITQIKTTYGKPVIALSTWEENSSIITRAKLIADFYLQMPFKIDAFMDAFEKCLNMLPKFNGIQRKKSETKRIGT
jgi:hypothetical protein